MELGSSYCAFEDDNRRDKRHKQKPERTRLDIRKSVSSWRQDCSGARNLQKLHRLCSWSSRLDWTKTQATLSELRAGLLEQKVGERISKGLLEESYSLFNPLSLKDDEVCYEICSYIYQSVMKYY